VTGSVPAATTSLEIAAFVRLIATSGSTQTTEFSGFVGPLQITPGATIPPIDVPLVRGPIANVFVTGVSIDQVPDTLLEGASDSVTASATSSRAGEPVLFWSVLDTAVLGYDGGVLTGRIAGNGRLVATAGFFSDTTSIVVVETPGVDVAVTKTVDEVNPLPGDAVTFTVEVTNNGPGAVTDLRVLDILSSDFTAAVHVVSAGTLDGDTLWLLPALDEGARETWTTTTTVAGSAAGGSATNAATLISVAANDTTPANDSASVSMSFPLSLLPTVTITAPADSAIFDPADLITFTATASDPEDGDLSAGITWASNLNGDLGTGPSVASDALDTGVHLITATVTDSDGGLRTDSLLITVALYSIPATLNVPFGNSASLPITLSEPAPVGGVTLTVLSDNATITEAQQPSVFIPGGALAANATLLGLTPGEATVTVSNPQYGAFSSDVSVTAALDIARTSFTLGSFFTETLQLTFRSQGTPIGAPTGGLALTLVADDVSCVSTEPGVAIAQGQTSTTATVVYGGGASLPCTTFVRASSGSVDPDSVAITVVNDPQITTLARTVGSGLQNNSSFNLGLSNHGGVTVKVKSSDPSTMLVSPNTSTAGTDSILIAVPNGTQSVAYYVQGVELATGAPTVTVSAPGFTDGTGAITVVQPGITLGGVDPTLTTFDADDAFYASIGIPSGNTVSGQQIRAGGSPITVTFQTDNTSAGVLTDGVTPGASVTAEIGVQRANTPTSVAAGGVAHDPLAAGSPTISASTPNFVQTVGATVIVTIIP